MPEAVTTDDVRRLALEVEALLLDRLAATSDPSEKEVLRAELRKTRDSIDDITAETALELAHRLNTLSDRLRAANSAVRDAPFDGIASRMQSTFDRLQDAVGGLGATIRGGAAEDEERTSTPGQPGAGTPPASPSRPARPSRRTGAADGRGDYAGLFKTCQIQPERLRDTQRIVDRIAENARLYEDVARAVSRTMPWFVVGLIHSLEASLSLRRHLHNGDPLTAQTVQVPAGRPRAGTPPFSWKESALDALLMKKLDEVADWTLPAMLERVELYNGPGYLNRGMNSPYLWSFSQHWTKGKFVADHVFDPEAPSSQCGAAVLLRDMVNRDLLKIEGTAGTVSAQALLGHRSAALAAPPQGPAHVQKEIAFPGEVSMGSGDKKAIRRVQEWCSFHRTATPVDGEFGPGTRDAVKAFQATAGIPEDGVVDQRTWSALTTPMLRVLAPIAQATATLNDAVVAVGHQHVAEHPIELGGDNMGAWVRLYMAGREGEEQQWCAGFLCFVIEQAARARGEKMPFPRQVAVAALIADAKASGRFIAGADLKTAAARLSRLRPGCVFVIKTASVSHAGIVTAVGGDSFESVEGNTDEDGGSRGFEAIPNRRNYVDKDFILLA